MKNSTTGGSLGSTYGCDTYTSSSGNSPCMGGCKPSEFGVSVLTATSGDYPTRVACALFSPHLAQSPHLAFHPAPRVFRHGTFMSTVTPNGGCSHGQSKNPYSVSAGAWRQRVRHFEAIGPNRGRRPRRTSIGARTKIEKRPPICPSRPPIPAICRSRWGRYQTPLARGGACKSTDQTDEAHRCVGLQRHRAWSYDSSEPRRSCARRLREPSTRA